MFDNLNQVVFVAPPNNRRNISFNVQFNGVTQLLDNYEVLCDDDEMVIPVKIRSASYSVYQWSATPIIKAEK